MLVAGLDIGSRTIALVEWDGERIVRAEVVNTGTDPLANSRRLTHGRAYDRLIVPIPTLAASIPVSSAIVEKNAIVPLTTSATLAMSLRSRKTPPSCCARP